MGNHDVECPTCHQDLRGIGGGHISYCPGENPTAEEQALFEEKREKERSELLQVRELLNLSPDDKTRMGTVFVKHVQGQMAHALLLRGITPDKDQWDTLNNADITMREVAEFFYDLGFTCSITLHPRTPREDSEDGPDNT